MSPSILLHPKGRALSVVALCILAAAIALGWVGRQRAATLSLSDAANAAGLKAEDRLGTERSASSGPVQSGIAEYGKLPLSFEKNDGQTDRAVTFLSRGSGYGIFLTRNGSVLTLRKSQAQVEKVGVGDAGTQPAYASTIRLKILGAHSQVGISGEDELPGTANYFVGDKSRWRSNIQTFSRVRYHNIYSGIDLLYYGNKGELEYDFVVNRGASPRRIKMSFRGARAITGSSGGDLILQTPAGDLRLRRPTAYQNINGKRREVAVRYRVTANQVTFELGVYNPNEKLIIDPTLVYSSYLGGSSGEQGLGIAVDSQGSAYLAGSTTSTDFPTVGAAQPVKDAVEDGFVVKLNASGTAIVYSTYLGGNGTDIANAIAVDSQGSAYVTGLSASGSFPRVGGIQSSLAGLSDAFVTKLSPSGSTIAYSTFLGGENNDSGLGIAVDATGRAYVVGRTDSTRLAFVPLPRHGSPVYMSTNGGATWAPDASGLTASTINALTIDPANANTIFAASINGVFKTTDGGASWNLTGTARAGTAPISTNAVIVDPTNSSVVYAGSFAGVHKSVDGGGLYDLKNTGLFVPVVNVLAIDPTTPTTLYAGTISGIFKSTNAGDSWAEVRNGISGSSPAVNEIALDPTNPAIVYIGTNRGMFKSTNGGGLWTAINGGALSNPFTPSISALAIDPLNPAVLYAAGRSGNNSLFKSTDSGAGWIASSTGLSYIVAGQTVIPTINTLAVDPITSTTLYAATSSGGIFKSIDGGATWSQSNSGLANSVAGTVVVDRTNPAKVYTGVSIGNDAFAVRLDPNGNFDYLMNFGGSESDAAQGVAVDANGSAYIVGSTSSADFPISSAMQSSAGGFQDAFVTKLNPSGNGFVYSTYLGGSNFDQGRGIAVLNGNAFVTGVTNSPNFPVVNAFKSSLVTFDTDAFVTKLNTTGTAAEYSTYLGGDSTDQGFAIAVDAAGNAYVTGSTLSTTFPVLGAIQSSLAGSATDAFITKLAPAGNALVYSTYLGGTNSDQGNGIAVDSLGGAYVIGTTSSTDFPTARPFQAALKGTDAFVAKIGVETDLSITKRDSRDPVLVNTPFTYTVTVSNNGPSPATGVTVADNLPAGMTLNAAVPSQGSCSFSNPTVSCTLGSLANGMGAVINISVTPTVTGTLTNTATVNGNEPDLNPSNNSASEATKISASPSISGHVRGLVNGLGGIVINLSGSQTATTQTDSNGFYQFAELPAGGNYTVTPSNSGFSFDPESQSFSPLNLDQTADFVASACVYNLGSASQSFSAAGGSSNVTVNTLHGCPWTATSSASFLSITSGATGVGTGLVSFSVTSTTAPRSAHLTIAGKSLAVYQEFNSCDTPSYSVATYGLSTPGPTLVRIADLNGDGHADFVVSTNAISGGGITDSVLLNDGTGGFTSSSFDTGLGVPQGIVVADFNGDGKPDIAMTTYAGAFVRIFFNNGSGGFSQANKSDINFTTAGGSAPTRDLFTADLNRDGKADLVVQLPGTGFTQILLGNGNGTFTQVAAVSDGTAGNVIGLADVNGDNVADFIYGDGSDTSKLISVRLGDGLGAFGSLISSSGTQTIVDVEPADFDGDGNIDLAAHAIVNIGTPSNPNYISALSILVGDGAGHFVLKSSLSIPQGSLGNFTIGDFNRDGKADVAFTKGTNIVTIVVGDGNGGLGNSVIVDTGATPLGGAGNEGLGNADFSGDGIPDIATADYSGSTHVLRNACAATPSISGRITDSRTTGGLAGATVTLSGAKSATVQTDGSGNFFFGNLAPGGNYVVTPASDNFHFAPANASINNLSGNQAANFVGTPTTFQFTSQDYVVDEGAGNIQISVRRNGDLSGVSTVDYATGTGTASARTDYTAAFGTLRFNPGESLKSFTVLVTDDALVEGWESLSLVLSDPVGGIFNSNSFEGPPNTSLLEIRDNDVSTSASNPVDNAAFFVRQHYHDFLNREADQSGLDFWTGQITSCGTDAACIEVKRINVSAAFFLSIEFQQTGYLVERMYKAAYGDTPASSTLGGAHQLNVPIVRLNEFLKDTQRIGQGVVVLAPGWEQALESNKQAYAGEFVATSRFITAFPTTITPAQFVDRLNQNAGNVLSANERTSVINLFGGAGDTSNNSARLQAVRQVAEDPDLYNAEFNRAFVLSQFFGYLRRNPNDPQDTDYTGYEFWLNKLNQFNGDYIAAEMVKAFISSGEYRQRFGP